MDEQEQSRWLKRGLWLSCILLALLLVLILIQNGYTHPWTGFGRSKVNGEFQSAKTLWDWLKLLIVPAMLALIGYLFSLSQNRATERATQERGRDEALQAYLDKMAELLIDGHIHEKADQYDTTRITARARTLAVLRRLDGERKRTVLLFLREARLINRYDFLDPEKGGEVRYYAHYIGLEDADLSETDLDGARLISTSGIEPISLKGADLKGAKLSGADLRGSELRNANLSGADLTSADLSRTNLSRANLSDVDLCGADLGAANLGGAYNLNSDGSRQVVTNKELGAQAAFLAGATMPNGQKYEDWLNWLKDREDRKEDGENDGSP